MSKVISVVKVVPASSDSDYLNHTVESLAAELGQELLRRGLLHKTVLEDKDTGELIMKVSLTRYVDTPTPEEIREKAKQFYAAANLQEDNWFPDGTKEIG